MSEIPTDPNEQAFAVRLFDRILRLEPGRTYTIGRDAASDLCLGHRSVSAEHCRLAVTSSQVRIQDLGSTNGIRLAGEKVQDALWLPGQILEVGDIRIELERRSADPILGARAAPLVHHRAEFGDVMFAELKRAPWLLLSILVHAALLLLAWFLFEKEILPGPDPRHFSVEQQETHEAVVEEEAIESLPEVPEVMETEVQEVAPEEEVEARVIDSRDLPGAAEELGSFDGLLTRIGGGTDMDDILREGRNAISNRFRRTVASLRKGGLDIVFVFDSTGSMGAVLQATKDRLARMIDVLEELVPFARIGVITYRDRGDSEEYLLREVALGRDYYRAMNFVRGIYANGGGDVPEAVYDGLREAVRQRWGGTARRLIILVGDAPPHGDDTSKINSLVQGFARNGRSFVHAIITRPSASDGMNEATEKAFQRIAEAGKGEALAFEDEQAILRHVMSLAFGKQETRSLDEVYRLVEARGKRVAESFAPLAQGRDLGALGEEFRKDVVPHGLIDAILEAPEKAVLRQMIDYLSRSSMPNSGRHAAAFVLQRVLDLEQAPFDPETCAHPDRRTLDMLRGMLDKRPL